MSKNTMFAKGSLVVLFILILSCAKQPRKVYKTKTIGIIPKPTLVEKGVGFFTLNDETIIVFSESDEAKLKAQQLGTLLGIGFSKIRSSASQGTVSNSIILKISEESIKDTEGYTLDVSEEHIRIGAPDGAGLFYGIQTLRQLLPKTYKTSVDIGNRVCKIPTVNIIDSPKFGWRGMMLDVSRHFLPTDSVKRFIDHLARYKFNVFHIHLTDDQGWRFESEKYPKLTEIGAWRVDRSGKRWFDREPQRMEEKPSYGGFYTKEELKDIVAYARSKHIEVLPEIDVPGHSRAIVASYPELGCATVPVHVATGGIASNNTVNPGKEEVYLFLEGVIEEVAEIFPFPYIHIGGDEAIKTNWLTDSFCQKKMKEQGLRDVDELQSYFIKRVEKIVNGLGKSMIGWDEILEGGLAPNATVMSWRGVEGGTESANMGHDVIMSPNSNAYFDLFQGDPKFEPDAYHKLWLKEVYDFNPVLDEITLDKRKHILGGHGALWTEFVPNLNHAEYMLFPRMLALSEAIWSKEKSDWNELLTNIDHEFRRLDTDGINYSKSIYNVNIVPEKGAADKTMIKLFTQSGSENIRYTMDGSDPTASSTLYKTPFEIPEQSFILKAAAFEGDKIQSNVITGENFVNHLARGAVATLDSNTPQARIIGKLTDGVGGSRTYMDGRWLPVASANKYAVIQVSLNKSKVVEKVSMNFLQDPAESVFWPSDVVISISKDGKFFKVLQKKKIIKEHQYTGIKTVQFNIDDKNIKAVKVVAKNEGGIRAGLKWQGRIYIDEIKLE
ncbi:family 20 glycosylhydrolase [Muricauda sp. SCSIO 64092]|uniref:beta-N-acetylhexosaminidase n=1 Tax=Allomuricauda sp. SCSIO 64092 TaxID=2908842 RepID=UPI001FF4F229|nr:family 20 glycosylhydrolase [Muricauda sp. SCSIO 64092]UOY04884.1 family 20 glycosylhydrolase [Muricauda sp. SCSIO 64092]